MPDSSESAGPTFIGRECRECYCYFETAEQTAEQWSCYCPYCGLRGNLACFYTQEQFRAIADPSSQATSLTAFLGQVARSEFGTEIECDRCAQRFVAFGVFKGCPGCGLRIPLHFLKKNLQILRKEIALAQTLDPIYAAPAIATARKNAVALDRAFRHEVCGFALDPEPEAAPEEGKHTFSLEKLERAKQQVGELSVFDFPSEESAREWVLVNWEKNVLDYLSLVEDTAEDWIEQYQQKPDPAP